MSTGKSRAIANNIDVTIQEEVDKDSPFDIDAIQAKVVYTNANNEPKSVAATVILDFSYLQDKYEKELGRSIDFDTVKPDDLNRFVLDAAESAYGLEQMRHPAYTKFRIVSNNGRLRCSPDVDMQSTAHQGILN